MSCAQPSPRRFDEIGQLAAVHTFRTALNYFLGRDIREEREQLAREDGDPGRRPGGGSAGSAGGVTGTATPPPRG